jgi:ribokinase
VGRVVVVGSVNVDLVVRLPRLPGPGETVSGGTFERTHGGKGANQAVAAARLGAETWLVGATGDDDLGRDAREVLRADGVDVTFVRASPEPTGVAAILVDASGENLIGVALGANAEVRASDVASAVRAVAEPESVVLAVLEVPDDAVVAAAEAARERGCRFLLNPAPARPLPRDLLASCDVVTPNEHEVHALGFGSIDGLLAAGAGAVVLTRGHEGADVYRPGADRVHVPAFPAVVVDTTGAGDAFSGALAWSLSEGMSLEEAAVRACAAGALATSAPGARGRLPTLAALERLLATAG